MSVPDFAISEASVVVTTLAAAPDGQMVIPAAELLFNADLQRSGHDLMLVNDGAETLRIPDYFATDTPADLHAPDGAMLTGAVVSRLAGPLAPGQYAQSGTAPGADPIGQVETMEGAVSVQRADGTIETLAVGVKIFADDVLQTGSDGALSVTFVDGTIFSLAAGSRMVIDDLIYDPDSSANSGSFNLIQGSFVFIAGQVAKTGGMDVSTPSATMGIRGTTVIVEVESVNGVVSTQVTLTRDPDGHVGAFVLRDLSGNEIANITDTDTKWLVSTQDGEIREVPRTLADDVNDSSLVAMAVTAFQSATARVDAGDTYVTLGDPAPNNNTTPDTPQPGTDFEVDEVDEPDGIAPDEVQPEPQPIAEARFTSEAERLLGLLDAKVADRRKAS